MVIMDIMEYSCNRYTYIIFYISNFAKITKKYRLYSGDFNSKEETSGESFDFWGVNVALIIGNLVLAHQVKHKDIQRRKSFLRAMNYVHYQSNKITNTQLQQIYNMNTSNLTYSPYFLSTPKTTTRMQRVPFVDSHSRGFDITTVQSIREKLTAAVLESVVDKSFVGSKNVDITGKSRKESDSDDVIGHQKTSPCVGNINFPTSPQKMRKHEPQRSKLFDEMRREITKRDTAHSISSVKYVNVSCN